MKSGLYDSLQSLLENDASLQGLLGTSHVFRAQRAAPPNIPCLTWKPENETGYTLPGYNSNGRRDHSQVLLLNIYDRESQDHADKVEARLDELLMPGITGTRNWMKVSRSSAWDDDVEAWHVVIRYTMEYTLTDS